ncbi:precorrin-4 C11-methyltransferase [Raineyella antarctica]|uniref:Precorrin-4 C11-methyltransferase n=1 Tax=Raineyella antarctica TaxID=1577474 RepID=A0A1G6GFM8_9ACTN|nr:precorrin-4 C(11)-methyltransferase [Raineyella antarctica]SDB80565.1 precorrin-4 C11-methyltransferase [Raineyella antarctica]
MTVHFIGAGPGAADLLTFRAAALMAAAPVCLYAGTYITREMLAHCPADVELVDTAKVNLDEQVAIMKRATEEGRDVARLCSGDPSLYSAIAEQTRRLDAEGVEWDVTPGVPAYAAAAALVGKELTVPEVAQTVILTRAQRDSTKMPPEESLRELARTHATLVLHLAITFVRQLQEVLVPEYGEDCPVVVVSRAEQPEELILRGTLADIADQVEAHGLRQAAIIIVGWALDVEDFPESHLYRTRHR